MMLSRIILIGLSFALAASALQATASPADPQPGVARELARFRAAHYRDIRYKLQIELMPGTELMRGSVEIRVTVDAGLDELIIDWRRAAPKEGQPKARAWDIVVNGREAKEAREANEHIIIPGSYLVPGENVVEIKFESPISTSGSAVTRYLDREDKSEYLYSLFVPSDASTAFPCFDQPDLKARFRLSVATRTEWKVISNSTTEIVTRSGTNSFWQFRETQPLSTYVFAFAAGPFERFDDKTSTIPMSLFVRKSKAERAQKELSEIFRLHRECLAFLEGYFDFKYPFQKYDVVILPEFAYGGMEHAGATFLREDRVLFPSDPTANDFAARAELICHEAAHQWFGDLVTMRWFDDLWLKEGFATFMAYKAIEKVLPQYSAWKVFYQRTKPGAYATDVTKGTTPIFQEIPNLSAAKSAYGNIVYLKAPSLLRQAEFYLGPDKFQRAVQSLLKAHQFSNAEWADLVGAFEASSGRKLKEWAAAWVRRRGLADVRVEWTATRTGRVKSLRLRQTDVLGEGGTWPLQVKLLMFYESAPAKTLNVTIRERGVTNVREAIGARRPSFIFANYEDYGYGRFLLDEKSRDYVLKNLGTVKDDFLRALLWGSLWDSVREAELSPSDYIELAIRLIPEERDEVTAQGVLSRLQTAFNRYLSEAQQRAIAPQVEQMVARRMMDAETSGLRITSFRAYQGIASTESARETLKKILRGEAQVTGMQLRSRDRFDMITALLVRDDPDALRLLEAQSEADNSDDGRRYSYAAHAGQRDEGTKKKYFDAYLNDTKLAESWIEDSLGPFNSIHQSRLTLPYLDLALKELPKLKRTRKIFFVNGWLSAFVGGQCNADAQRVVEEFLRREQALDRDLRLKVLEVLDGLQRCVRIRERFAQ